MSRVRHGRRWLSAFPQNYDKSPLAASGFLRWNSARTCNIALRPVKSLQKVIIGSTVEISHPFL